MFKNVAQALKITNHDARKSEKRQASRKEIEATSSPEMATAARANTDENFIVRQSRKKLSKFVARLQKVRTLSTLKQANKKDGSQSKTNDKLSQARDYKIVKFKLTDGVHDDDDDAAALSRKLYDWEDSDDDDAYVSASETFDGEEPTTASGCDKIHPPITSSTMATSKCKLSRSEDELANGDNVKFMLPEEKCDIPTFLYTENCDKEIIEETRRLLKERYANNPDSFYEDDYQRMLADDWTVTRFLLRRRLDPRRTAKLMEECGKFRREYLMSEIQLWEFPIEFHLAGGLFKYAPDRVGNMTMFMRVKMYRRVPEISDVFKAFILCVLEQCDVESNGRGTAVVFDLTACGLQNVDLGFLYWLLNSFRNYCPKGVSYILVYNLPWFLSATAKLAMTWMSETNRRALRFVQGKEIENFIAPENLPAYLGGTCPIDYHAVPEGSRPAVEVCDRMDITVAQALKIKELFKEYLPENYEANIPPAPSAQAPDSASGGGGGGANLDSQSHGSNSTLEAGSVPVVELVSQASKFMATNL